MKLDLLLDLESWREGGACFDRLDVSFFPSPEDHAAIVRAKALCASCPVLDDCLAFALETNQTDGIWGGTTPQERVRFRRRWLRDLKEAS